MNDTEQTAGRRSLADTVFEHMFRAIKSGAYAEGERLPTEHDLAAEFQVSRPVVREALKRLRDQELIHSRRGAGSFVRNAGLRQPLGFTAVESIADLQRCYEFRITLEPEAARTAAQRHTTATLARIEAALNQMRDATVRQKHREDADFDFHLGVARASGNQYFFTAMEALKDHIAVGMQFHGQSLKNSDDGLAAVYAEHRAIFEAIRNGRGDAACDLMRNHLKGSRDRLFEGRRPPEA